jgi:hypothetical protein
MPSPGLPPERAAFGDVASHAPPTLETVLLAHAR